MSANTEKEILKQDYHTVKSIKEKPESNYAQIYKEMMKNNNKNKK